MLINLGDTSACRTIVWGIRPRVWRANYVGLVTGRTQAALAIFVSGLEQIGKFAVLRRQKSQASLKSVTSVLQYGASSICVH